MVYGNQAFCCIVIHVKICLGSPMDALYTNDVESVNHIVKRKTNYRVCEWPEFCSLAKELVEEQDNEIEKAVFAVGE